MKKLLFTILLITISIGIFANPYIKVPTINPPNIDGYITEWEGATKLTTFLDLNSNSLTKHKAYVWLGCDKDNIYLAYRFYKPTTPKASATDRKDGAFWEDDDFEFFFTPKNQNGFYQILTNATGNYRDICGNGITPKPINCECKAHISDKYNISSDLEDHYWEGEMKIPFGEIGITDKDEISFLILGSYQLLGLPEYFVFCDGTNKVNANIGDTSKWATLSFGSPVGIDFKNDYASDFSATKDIKAVFTSEGEEFLSKITKEVNEPLPKGSYILKTEYYDGDALIYSNSLKCLNMKVITTNFENNILSCSFDFTAFKEPKVSMITLSQGERVFAGGSYNNNKAFSEAWDMSNYPKGEYELFVNVLGEYKEIITINKE
ncbi:MAG: hypothetical protein IJS60_06010 [Abditibacteriota bacterium]|nr:hypothetical protein [Abditibacteriota bacterium]